MAFEAPSYDALLEFGLALGLGGLIGIERERHRRERLMLAGIRTYPLVALTGLVTAYLFTVAAGGSIGHGAPTGGNDLSEAVAAVIISIGAVVTGGFALFMYWVRQREGTLGLTSPIALFATYFVGVLVGLGLHWEAIVAGLAIALLLFTKDRLHHFAEILTQREMEGALYFLILALVLYPITPDRPIDPWDLLNLRSALLIVLLVSFVSFLSFLAVRRWGGEYGLPFSGLAGGLVSSEATAASLATLFKERKPLQRASYTGILLATGTMFLRNLVIAAIADPDLALARAIALGILVPSLVYLVWAAVLLRHAKPGRDAVLDLQSPFAFRPAFKFAFWFVVVSVGTLLLTRAPWLGDKGVYAAALGGLVSAGAVVASMGALVHTGGATLASASVTAIVASLLGAVNKLFIARLGGNALLARMTGPTLVAVALGSLLLLV